MCLLSCAVVIVGIFRLSAENCFLDYFKDSTDVHCELSFIDADFDGSTALDICTISQWNSATNLSVGRAMVYTSAVIVIGFAALVFSGFYAKRLLWVINGPSDGAGSCDRPDNIAAGAKALGTCRSQLGRKQYLARRYFWKKFRK